MLPLIADTDMPGLAALTPEALSRITGAARVELLRLRYRPGARAVLHVAFGAEGQESEGVIWLFAGGKARKIAATHSCAHLDPDTQALFEPFPHDHRFPALACFAADPDRFAPALIGGPAAGPPRLLRYRPGISAAFRWQAADGRTLFVKLMPDADARDLYRRAHRLADALAPGLLTVPDVAGYASKIGAVAFGQADGQPLDASLADASPARAAALAARVAGALPALWACPVLPHRHLDRPALIDRATRVAATIAFADPAAGRAAATLVDRLRAGEIPMRFCPIHADLKLEHVFLSEPAVTLIDTESLSLGDPAFDLACLEARLIAAAATGALRADRSDAARAALRQAAGPHHDRFLAAARLQAANYFAQRLPADLGRIMAQVLSG